MDQKKRGRKPLPPGQARTHALGIAFTPEEYARLTCLALATGRTLASVLREAALGLTRGDHAGIRRTA
jgi:hypothetical protein